MQQPTVSLLQTIRCLCILKWRLKKQARYFNEHLPLMLAQLSAGQSNDFSAGTIRRINKYWQLSLNVICNSLYQLRGLQLSEDEQHRILLLSIFGPLYDDLFDDHILSHEQLDAFTRQPEKHIPQSFEEHVVKEVYLQLLSLSPDREKVIAHLHEVFVWQQASLKQMSPDVSEADLYEITYKKSYYSILLYYSILDHYPAAAVQKMLYPMAGLLQLTNDAFDVYKDVHSGIYTIPNLYRNFERLQQHFMDAVAEFNHYLAQLPFAQPAKAFYSITMHALHGMGCIAMQQLKANTRGVASMAELASLGRKALVCDMDSLSQQIKWVKQVKYLVNYRQPVHAAAAAAPVL
jgi:hypothetical protein